MAPTPDELAASAEPAGLTEDTADDLYEHAPCGFLSTRPDGTLIRVNQTLLDWLGYDRADLVGRRTFQQLLTVGGRIYHDTHYAPLLRMQGAVREIAVELVRRDGSRLPALVNSVLRVDSSGAPVVVRTTVFDATARRGYERELLEARQAAERAGHRLSLLQQVVADFAAAATSAEVGDVLVGAALRAVRAVGSMLWLLDDDGATLVKVSGNSPAEHPSLLSTPLDSGHPHADAVRRGEVVLLESVAAARTRYPVMAELMASAHRDSTVFVPLAVDDHVLGSVAFSFDASHRVDEHDVALLRTLGRQAGQALQRARLFEVERRLRQRAEVLQRITAALAATLDAAQVARIAVDRLAASLGFDRIVFVLDRAGRPGVAASHGIPADAVVPDELGRVLADEPPVFATGREHADLLSVLPGGHRPAALVILPLRIGGRSLGALLLGAERESPFGAAEREFLETFAAQCAQALERARLHGEAVEGQRRADFLAALSRRLDEQPGLQRRAELLVTSLVPTVADRADVELFRDGRAIGAAIAPATRGPAGDIRARRHVSSALETGTPAIVNGPGGDLRALAVPLRARGQVVGALDLGFDPSGDALRLGGDPLRFVTEIAESVGLALENGRLYDQERDNAHTLQRGLLAGQPPRDPRIEIVTHYSPAGEDLEAGGDWHDSFLLGPDRVALVVGDVVGRGVAAASAMGQVRTAIRALASVDTGPARLLEQLDRFVERFDAGRMATVVYGELELSTGRLRYACAGHLPPLLVTAEGTHRFLWGGRSVPLAAYTAVTGRGEDEVVLEPGSRLLFYTDGLVERRGKPVDLDMARLGVEAVNRGAEPLTSLLPDLVDLLVPTGHHDDVCLLCVGFTGDRSAFERELPADVAWLSSLRDDLASWLVRVPLSGDDRDAVVLACSEAAANAIEHGHGGGPHGQIRVRASVSGGVVELAVVDDGRWREPSPQPTRGRGLVLIRQLMDEVSVVHDDGTVVTMRRRIRFPDGGRGTPMADRQGRPAAEALVVRQVGDGYAARLAGDVDLAVAGSLEAQIVRLTAQARSLVLDLTDVTFLDSAGVRLVDGLVVRFAGRGGTVRIVVPPDRPAAFSLRVAGLHRDLPATPGGSVP